MVIDTSAIVAILTGEPEGGEMLDLIAAAGKRLMSAFSAVECAVVIESKKGPMGVRELDLFLHESGVEVVVMDLDQVALAREAYRRFGKGRHAAKLNLGACCSYALSPRSGEPLLFKGNDFTMTDVRPARPLR